MKKFVVINGTLRAPAYIGNVYYMGLEKISMEVLVSDKKSYAPEVVELSEESAKLVEDTIADLAKEVKESKHAAKYAAAKKADEDKAAAAGEIPLV